MDAVTEPSRLHPNKRHIPKNREELEKQTIQELDTRASPDRTGWPCLLPLPLRTQRGGATFCIEDPRAAIAVVEEIFTENWIDPMEMFFAFRTPFNIGEEQPCITAFLTLVVAIDMFAIPARDRAEHLKESIVQTREYFVEEGSTLQYVYIEVIDHRVLRGFNMYVLESGHELYTKKDEVARIVQEEADNCERTFKSVEVVRRGASSYEHRFRCPVTVIITTSTAGDNVWWKKILPAINKRVAAMRNGEGALVEGMVVDLQQGFETGKDSIARL